ncbi:MAG: hypothetical protein IPI66_02395 [Chitinophagaceae bacterium]|nr:hypothetical protein [Chitinophagaceae bacterium]
MNTMIPNTFHFIFGLKPDFGGIPFSLVHYLSIRSAIELNKPDKVLFHFTYEPSGEWWEKIRPSLTLNKIHSPEQVFGRPLVHVAHKADVVRLQALRQYGGVYLDLDTICIRPFQDLLQNDFVMGQEHMTDYVPKNWHQRFRYKLINLVTGGNKHRIAGLCNAVLMSAPDSEFVNLWLNSYASFRSAGRDKYWNEHSVIIPHTLSIKYPGLIRILDPQSFYFPLYDKEGLESLFEKVDHYPKAYLYHLWETNSWEKYLKKLTVEDIMEKDTTYNLVARKYL